MDTPADDVTDMLDEMISLRATEGMSLPPIPMIVMLTTERDAVVVQSDGRHRHILQFLGAVWLTHSELVCPDAVGFTAEMFSVPLAGTTQRELYLADQLEYDPRMDRVWPRLTVSQDAVGQMLWRFVVGDNGQPGVVPGTGSEVPSPHGLVQPALESFLHGGSSYPREDRRLLHEQAAPSLEAIGLISRWASRP